MIQPRKFWCPTCGHEATVTSVIDCHDPSEGPVDRLAIDLECSLSNIRCSVQTIYLPTYEEARLSFIGDVNETAVIMTGVHMWLNDLRGVLVSGEVDLVTGRFEINVRLGYHEHINVSNLSKLCTLLGKRVETSVTPHVTIIDDSGVPVTDYFN